MDKLNINIYEEELTKDKPIPYLPVATENLKKELACLSIKVNKTDEDIQRFNILNEYLKTQIIYIYPFLIDNYFTFFSNIKFLQIRKNEVSNPNIQIDPKVISMKYLDYLFYLAEKSNDDRYVQAMITILTIGLKAKEIIVVQDKKRRKLLKINNVFCTWEDFDNIRRIICYQNILDFDDGYVDPKFRQAMEEVEQFKSKHIKQASLEELMSCIVVSTGYKYEEIYNMSIRKFYLTLRRAGYKLDYQIMKTGMVNGTIKSDFKIQGWTESLSNKDKYSDMLVDFDEFKNKINKAN
jgi:hypothetical protein